MGNETETTNKVIEGAKAAGIGAIILAFIGRLFTWKKAKIDRLQAEITAMHSIINEWKETALSMIKENRELRLEIAMLRKRISDLEAVVKQNDNK